VSTKVSFVSLISPWENGHTVNTSIRPAKDSESFGRSITFADPVSRKRPGCRFRSIAALITGNSSGTCCISSNVTGGFKPATKPFGSPFAAARMPGSSNVRYCLLCFAQFRRLNEGTFARLPSAVDENSGRVGQCFSDLVSDLPVNHDLYNQPLHG
jgi:hypothetical protein